MNNIEFDSAIGFTVNQALKSNCNPHLMLASLEVHTHQLKNLILNAAQTAANQPKILRANGMRLPPAPTG